jgi:hypothetical protein
LVTLGYRENLSLSQIKTFLEMESHEERIQEIIERVCFGILNGIGICLTQRNRTRSWRPAKSASARPSNWKCSARRLLAQVEPRLLELPRTLSTHPQRVRLCPTPTIHTRLRRRNHLPSMCTVFVITFLGNFR